MKDLRHDSLYMSLFQVTVSLENKIENDDQRQIWGTCQKLDVNINHEVELYLKHKIIYQLGK